MEQPGQGQKNEQYKDGEDIVELEQEAAELDAQIIELVQRRAEVAQDIADIRRANGGIAYPHSEALKDSKRWSNTELGAAIIKICRKGRF